MTFYNVISGILFMGACQAFLHLLDSPAMPYAAVLVVIMSNEAVLTSELLEDRPNAVYKLELKLIDLLTFFILAAALVILSPDSNTFGSLAVDKQQTENGFKFPFANSPWAYLSLLGLYGLVALLWNWRAGRATYAIWNDNWKWMAWYSGLLAVPFLVAAIWSYSASSFANASPVVGWILTSFVFFLMILKIWALKPAPAAAGVCKFRG